MTETRKVYSDLGESLAVDFNDGQAPLPIGRYGVWEHNGRKWQVVATYESLEKLKLEHGELPRVDLKQS